MTLFKMTPRGAHEVRPPRPLSGLPWLFGAALLIGAACAPAAQPAPTSAPTAAPAAPKPAAPTVAPAPPPTPAAAPKPSAAPVLQPAASPVMAPSAAPSAAAITIGGPFAGEAQALNGAGGTFPAPLYQKWFDEYAKLTKVQVNYQAIGSGGGIKGIQDQTVDFGASDAPMTDAQLAAAKGGQIFHIPTALGAIVMTYNIPGYSTKMKLNSDTIAGIFLGTITKWNDPKLTADNPELASINQDIVVVHRSDGSGTTFGFTDYLSNANADWKAKVGNDTSVKWPVGLGGSGNAGVAGEVQQNPNSIGYVELIYAVQNKLPYATVKNPAGKQVDPSLDSVTAAAAASAQKVPQDLRFSIVNASGDTSYPICTGTWILAYKDQKDEAKAIALTRLLWWATHEAQTFNKSLEYAIVPTAISAKSDEFIRAINVNGKPSFPGR